MDWVKKEAKNMATEAAKDAVREVRVHPVLISAVAAGLGAIAVFAIVRKKQKNNRAAMHAPYYHALPMRSPNAAPLRRVVRTSTPKTNHTARRAFEVLKHGGQDALVELQRTNHKKAWIDRYIAPLTGALVLLGAISGAISSVAAHKKALAMKNDLKR